MAQTFIGRKRVRKFFGKIEEVAEMPNLIEVQKASYDQFLLVVEPQGGRPNEGLQAVFKSVFPISDFSSTSMLEFVKYEFEPPKYDVDECRQRGMTYAAPLKVTLRLIVFDIDEETGASADPRSPGTSTCLSAPASSRAAARLSNGPAASACSHSWKWISGWKAIEDSGWKAPTGWKIT
jgi:DNA-directed RNA polymerase beta subunit